MSRRCAQCTHPVIHLGDGEPPSLCEDCRPQTGPGSRLVEQLAVNARRLLREAGITTQELGRRAAMSREEAWRQAGGQATEPGLIQTLRFANSLGASIERLTERIYWNPGETARRPGDRRPRSQRLSGFFLVLPEGEPAFDPPRRYQPVAHRHQAAAIFGGNVRDARERRHLTREALAGAAGLSKDGLSLIERGRVETTIETLLSLARSLEVPPQLLLAGIASKPRRTPCAAPGRWRPARRSRRRGQQLPRRGGSREDVHQRGQRRRERCPRVSSQKAGDATQGARVVDRVGSEAGECEIATRLGANIASCREKAGLTLRELGEATELDRSYLHHIEHGKRASPRISLVIRLAASFNVPCGRIVAGIAWDPTQCVFQVEESGVDADTASERLRKNFRRARRRAGISQQALATQAAANRTDVSDFERGENRRIFTVVRLIGALGVDLTELFAGVLDWYIRPLPAPEYPPGQRPTKAERDALLMRLWRQGRPEAEISDALGLAHTAVGGYVRELRDAGKDLPYRHPPRSAAEIAARRRRGDRCLPGEFPHRRQSATGC